MTYNKTLLAVVIGSAALLGSAQLAAEPTAEMMAATCAGCHGPEGRSTGPATPTLAGYSEGYFIDSMIGFKEGERQGTIMNRIAKGYTEEQIESMATYFAEQPVYMAKQNTDAAKVAQGAEIYENGCAKCHDENGALPDDDAGILAGQILPYLHYSIEDFQAERRYQPKKMAKQLSALSPGEIDAVLQFFASQQP